MLRAASLASVGLTLAIALVGPSKTKADPFKPGAPLTPSQGVLITIDENTDEGIAQVRLFATGVGQNPPIDMIIPKIDGKFTLPVLLQPGSVGVRDAGNPPTSVPSDTIVLEASAADPKVTVITGFASDIRSEPAGESTKPELNESLAVTGAGDPPGRTIFHINSPAEPVPEPSTLIVLLAATGTLAVAGYRHGRTRR